MPQRRNARRGPHGFDSSAAEAVGLSALLFVSADPTRLRRFFAATGLAVEDLKAGAHTAPMQAAILEHLAGDESLLLEFAANAGVEPADVARAQAALLDQR